MCPKKLSELKNAQRNVTKAGGKKVDFGAIVSEIVKSKLFWSVSEVHTQLIQKRIGRVRTLNLLNGASGKGHKLERLYENGKFLYGDATLLQNVAPQE